MNLVFDVFTAEDQAAVKETVESVITDIVSGRTVVYHSAAGTATHQPLQGTLVSADITRSVRAWRGAPQERESPPPDLCTRQYIILKRDLDLPTPAISPVRGDRITDDDGDFRILTVANGEIGTGIYYLLDTEQAGP